MLCAAPIKHNRLARPAQIVDCDRDKRVLPLHVFQIDFEGAKIRRHKLAGKNSLRTIDDSVVNPAVQLLRLRIAGNIQRFRQEIGVSRGSFLHFTPFDSSIGEWNFLYSLELVLIRNAKHRPNQVLFPSPRRGDIGHGFIPPTQPFIQHAGNHRERNQQHQDQRADS